MSSPNSGSGPAGTAAATAAQSSGVRSCAASGSICGLFRGKMVAVIHQVSGRRRFHRLTLDDRVFEYVVEQLEQGIAGRGDHAMLLQEPVDRQFHGGVAAGKPGKRDVFARMMKAVRKMVQVVDGIAHQFVLRVLAGVKDGHLRFQKIEQPGEPLMFAMP